MGQIFKIIFLGWTLFSLTSCTEEMKRSPFHFFGLLFNGNSANEATNSFTITYPSANYFFTTGQIVATISPTITGTLTSCSILPALPTGLTFNATDCSISGTATPAQPATLYTVTASDGSVTDTFDITITISNLPVVSFDLASLTNPENISPTLSVSLNVSSLLTVTVDYSISGGTATNGTDYTFTNGTLTFAPGTTTQNIPLTITDDALYELDETVIITLSNPTNTIVGAIPTHTYTITNNDVIPTVYFTTSNQSNLESTTTVTVTAELDAVSGLVTTVPFSINAGSTATLTTDYTFSPASPLSIPAGSTTANITFTIVNDTLNEADETIIVDMGVPTNATTSVNTTHTITIANDDPLPTLGFDSANGAAFELITAVNLPVSLSTASGQTVTVNYSVTGGTATGGGDDYTLASGSLTFTPGVTTQNISLSIINDTLYETNETIEITLDTPTNSTLAGNLSHTYTIINDEPMPNVQFTAASQTNLESVTTVTVTAQLNTMSGLDTTIPFTINGISTATLTTDYSFSPASPLTILAGATTADITFSIVNDTLYELDETIVIDIGVPTNATAGAISTHTITIGNEDPIPEISFTAGATASIGEGAGNYILQFTLSAISSLPASVTINTANGTGTAGSDYTAQVAQVVTIPAGSTTVDWNVPILEDVITEADETFTITMSAPSNTTLNATVTQTVTITDNEIGILSATTLDCDGNGKIDHYQLTFDAAVTDSSFPGYVLNSVGTSTTNWLVAGYTNVKLKHGTSLVCSGYVDAVDDSILYVQFDEGVGFDTGAKPDLTTSATPTLLGPSGTVGIISTIDVAESDSARPVVVSISPASGSTGVLLNTTVTATFSENMDAATFIGTNFTLEDPASITGTVSTVNATSVMFTPSAFLVNELLHTVNIINMADVNGVVMFNFSSTFTTALRNKITGTVTGASSNVVLGISVNGGAVTNLTGTVTTYDTGNVLVNGQTFELSIITQPVGQVCALLSNATNPAGGIFTGTTDLIVDVNCVAGYSISGRIQPALPAENGFHLFQGSVSTIFGDGTSSVVDGIGVAAKVSDPKGIVFTGGYYYFADAGTYIRQVNQATNQVLIVAGSATSGWVDATGTAARFAGVYDLTTDGTFLYAAELSGNRIRRIRIGTWEVTTLAGDTSTATPANAYLDGYGTLARFGGPYGLVYYNGSLYMSDYYNNRIRRINLSTLAVTTIAGDGSNATADSGTGVSGRIAGPSYMTLIGNSLFVASDQYCIRRIILNGGSYPLDTFAGVANSLGWEDGERTVAKFNQMRGMATDGVNNLFIADTINRNIRQINVSKNLVTTLAGQHAVTAHQDGVGIFAQFSSPDSLFFNGKDLVLADGARIRVINNYGLTAYFPLNGSGTDYKGSFDLTNTGSPTITSGRNNETNGAYYAGAGNGAKTSIVPTNSTNNVTLAGWVKWDGTNTGGIQILFFNGSSGSNGYGFLLNGNVFRCLFGGGTSLELTPKLVANEWTHIALVGPYTPGGFWRIFYNGKLIHALIPTVNPPTSSLTIGMNDVGGENFRGSVADVRLYNRSLNDGEINELAQNADSALAGSSFSTGGTGLLSHYGFFSGTLLDLGPLSKTVSNINTVTPAIGKDGDTDGSMQFNGSNNYLTASSIGFPIGNSPRTLCAWIKPSQSNVTHAIITYGVGGAGQAMGLSLQSSKYHFFNYGAGITSSIDAKLNTWQAVCGVYDGANGKIYVDGIELVSGSMGTVNTSLGGFHIGQNVDNNVRFPGKIDEVRVYNTALSAQAIRELSSQISIGLVARYDFNGDTNDVSGFGANLASSGSTTPGVDRFGVPNTARHFNGLDGNFLSVADTNLPKGSNPRTVCAWVRSESDGGPPDDTAVPISYGSGGARFGLWFQTKNIIRLWTEAGDVNASVAIPYYVWRHVCLVFTQVGNLGIVYLNGRAINTGSPTVNTSNGSLTIGSWLSGRPFGGQLDEVVIYNRALLSDEIKALSGAHPMQVASWSPTFGGSTLKFHLQADSISNLANNGIITNWADTAGGVSSTAFGSPTYQVAGLNGKPTVNLNNASSQYFSYSTSNMQSTTATLFVMFQRNSLTTYNLVGNLGSTQLYEHYFDAGNRFIYAKNGIGDLVATTTTFGSTTTPYLLTIQHNQPGSTGSAYLAESNVTSTTTFVNQAPAGVATGVNIGASSASGTFWNGKISELIYFHSVLSSADRILVSCYLSTKYGVALTGAICQ